MDVQTVEAPPSLEAMAERLDCFTEDGLIRLAGITPSTAEAWRKRGEGPAFTRIGNRVLYPRTAVGEWLSARVRERKPVEAKGLL
jgi:hypothetical protein